MNKTILLFSLIAACFVSMGEPVKSMVGANGTGSVFDLKPYDAEIEWLESNGSQWIDTCFYPDLSTVSCELKCCVFDGTSGIYGLFGVRTVASSAVKTTIAILCNPSYNQLRVDWAAYSFYDFLANEDLIISCGPECYVDVNGHEFSSENIKSTGRIGFSFYLFTVNSIGVTMPIPHSRLYYCRIYDGNELVRDLIPVRVGEIGYMYDRVSGELFGNMGTGEFILGPDVED